MIDALFTISIIYLQFVFFIGLPVAVAYKVLKI